MNKKAEGWVGTSVMLLILEEMLAVFFPFTDFGYGQYIIYYAEVLHPLVYPVFLVRECGVLS